MAIIAINYATKEYESAAEIQRTTYPIQVTTIKGNAIKSRKGNGLFKWKPIVILSTLKNMKEGDVLLYFDSTDSHSPEFFNFVTKHFENNNNLFILDKRHINSEFTKGDTFHIMNCIEYMDGHTFQVDTGLIGIRKTEENINLILEWNEWMKNEFLFDGGKSVYVKDFPSYKGDTTFDQSILTNILLSKKIDYSIDIEGLYTKNAHQPTQK